MSLNEWNENPDPETLAYHRRQSDPYRSTVAFAEFIAAWIKPRMTVLDMGCGGGAATNYLAGRFRGTDFIGIDVSTKLLLEAQCSKGNIDFRHGDMHDLAPMKADGVVSLQTFSWMPDIEAPLRQICQKVQPKFLSFSSLFYAGDISARIVVSEPKRPRQSYYNVYSVPQITRYVETFGYKLDRFQPYDIDVELPKPDNPDLMKTYTRNGLQFSGPLWLPWGFISFVETH